MDTSDLGTAGKGASAAAVKPRRTSRMSKAFWGLIGLLAVLATGLTAMAVMSLNKYTHETVQVEKPKDPDVEIIDLAGNSRLVSSNMLPANPLGEDESVVHAGTSDDAKALTAEKEKGVDLVAQVAVKPVAPPKKDVAVAQASNQVQKPVKAKEVEAPKKPKVDSAHIQKEANKQMDNLF